MKTLARTLFTIFAVSSLIVGCGDASQEAVTCEDARDHIAGCFPEQEARVPDSCSVDDAEEILSSNCDDLAAAASTAGKDDGFCNPFFWWLCGSSASEAEPTGYSFDIGINVCQSEICVEDLFGENRFGAECGKITLHDASGDVVATDYVNDRLIGGGVQGTGSGFDELDLPAGDYTARLWRRDGRLASNVDSEPAEIVVTFRDDGEVDLDKRDFKILASEADAIRSCSNLGGSLTSTCDGELQSKEDTSWSWIVRLEGTNGEGTYENIKRSHFVFSADSHIYSFPRVRPGSYTLSFIEVDVWSSFARRDYRNATYDEYLELIDRYATGVELVETIVVTEEEVGGSEFVSLSHIDLDSGVCL